MKARFGIGSVALAAIFALSGCGNDSDDLNAASVNLTAPLTQIPAPNGGDWTQVVSETAEGGYRMGNPDAPVKLVEYASITCPHCGEFAEAGGEELESVYVRSGQVSWEYRPFMIFPSDPGLFMLLRCQGPTPFFRLIDQLYDSQREWAGRLQSLPEAQVRQAENLPANAKAAFYIQSGGLDAFFRQRGMPQARINSCLADANGLTRLADITRRAGEQDGISGTPTFVVNGEQIEGIGPPYWPGVEPRLRAAIGG